LYYSLSIEQPWGEIGPDTPRGVSHGLHRVREMEEHQDMDERITQLELSLSDK